MFSIEDLLISHGYKLSKDPTNLNENRNDGFQHDITDRRSAYGTVNGFPATSGTYTSSKRTTTKGYPNDRETSHINQGWQLGRSYQKDFPCSANTRASEGGFHDQQQLAWSLHPKPDKDLAYWRRRGQDFSVLLGYTDRGSSERKGMAAPCAFYDYDKKNKWKVGGGTESVKKTSVPENWKTTSDYRWQSLRTRGWNQPTNMAGHMADGEREKLLRDMYSVRQGGTTVSSHAKGKSQSLPRVLSPETLNCIEVPTLVNSKHSLSGTEGAPFCIPAGQSLETSKHPEMATHCLPLPKPKYGRPLKPPSYELHQQTRGNLDMLLDEQQKEETISYSTKVNEPMPDGCTLDSGLEPPLYIPPPCYKSPSQQNMNRHLLNEMPDYDTCFNNSMQSPVEKSANYQSSGNSLKNGSDPCKEEQALQDKKSHPRHVGDSLTSVQYIPFDDPRIRHIKIAPLGSQEDGKLPGDASKYAFQEYSQELEYNSAFLDLPESLNTPLKCFERIPDNSTHSSSWLAEPNIEQDSCALTIQRDSYDISNDLNHRCPKGTVCEQSPSTEAPHEIVTKVKTFEPGTELQSKRSSKKKTNETIFCLVSIPVKSELNLPDTDRNNNSMQGVSEKNGLDNSGGLQEQSLLSTSSTDLELQALTGSMTNKHELQKQELWWKPEFKQMNDFRVLQPAKHKELQYSGSWPGDHYKDQQTQTNFTEEPKILQHICGLETNATNTVTTSKLLKHETSTKQLLEHTVSPADDRKSVEVASCMKSQRYLDKSSNSVCLSSKTCKDPPCTSFTTFPGKERETSSVFREEGSSKELFGQFLLKPVSRRPWDIISELESFNKEIQEQEEQSEDGLEVEDKETLEEKEEVRKDKSEVDRNIGLTQGHRPPGMQSGIVMSVTVKEKSKSESSSASENPSETAMTRDRHICASSQNGLQAKWMDKSVRTTNEYVIAEPRMQEPERMIIKQTVSPRPNRKVLFSNYNHENNYNPFNNIQFMEESLPQNNGDSGVVFSNLSKTAGSRNNLGLDRGSGMRLSLTNRNQGLSEPDLRSLGLDDQHGLDTLKPDWYKVPPDLEIPLNESLQARAARILGIEVAVESLMSECAPPDEHSHSDNVPQSLDLSSNKVLEDKIEAKVTSYEGRRKCGWTESSLFVGERHNPLTINEGQKPDQETSIAEQHSEHHRGLSRCRQDQTPLLETVALPFPERNQVLPSAEKRMRSTSKVIETLQGKLAAPTSRAAMDRLVRMKEVDSVSRMRRLSIKNADSTEDGDEEKQSKGAEERGSDTSFGRSELTRKLSHGSSVSKRIISLTENGLLDSVNEKKAGGDLFYIDGYDPTRVERV